MAKVYVDPNGISEIRTIVEQQAQTMNQVEQTIAKVLMNLDIQISATDNIKQSLNSLKNSSSKEREMLTRMSSALINVNDEFQATDHGLLDKARDVNYALDYIIADAITGFSEEFPLEILTKMMSTGSLSTIFGAFATLTTPINLHLLFDDTAWDILDAINKTSGILKDTADYSEWIEKLFGSEMFGEISDFLGDVKKNDYFKVAGYLGDGKKLVDALGKGDADAIEKLIEKYGKKGIKTGIKLVTGHKVTGVVNSVYLDLAWNLGENSAESIREFIDDPSLNTAVSGLWNMTAGTIFDAATGLAEDALSYVADLTESEFDADDFGNAMDYLWNHPVESLVATGEVIADGVASFFDWLF